MSYGWSVTQPKQMHDTNLQAIKFFSHARADDKISNDKQFLVE